MRSAAKKNFYFHADANALGGLIEEPLQKIIPSHSSVSLPPVGGHATSRSELFNFEEIVSCRSAHTRVAGTTHGIDGPWSVLVTAVVEDFNILQVVTAEKIVAQLSVDYFADNRLPRISLAGSHFVGLRIAGYEAKPQLSSTLLDVGRTGDTSQAGITFDTFLKTGEQQAAKLLGEIPDQPSDGPDSWLFNRFGWMDPKTRPQAGTEDTPAKGNDDLALCSLVDQVEPHIPGNSYGHVVEIPDFGRIFLGELVVTRRTIQLTMVRAELGCTFKGNVSGGSGGVGSVLFPP